MAVPQLQLHSSAVNLFQTWLLIPPRAIPVYMTVQLEFNFIQRIIQLIPLSQIVPVWQRVRIRMVVLITALRMRHSSALKGSIQTVVSVYQLRIVDVTTKGRVSSRRMPRYWSTIVQNNARVSQVNFLVMNTSVIQTQRVKMGKTGIDVIALKGISGTMVTVHTTPTVKTCMMQVSRMMVYTTYFRGNIQACHFKFIAGVDGQ
ncbi:hypothetical protein HOLleu_23631 [Holothuria leucospilota]|uniref:Uncharacterized protein n=1 Tax=Holothuria leucospilota TaxID=206669 RepID=A0A9Q1BV53_HOLLE|nr:hypothetical protein HOLleu_23631 [Holothuria leucospilota]